MSRPVRAVWRPVLWGLVAVLVVATGVVAATGGRDWYETRRQEQAQREALAAGRQLAVNFTTLDYRTVDADTARVRDGATGAFLEQYTTSLADLRKVIVDNRSTSTVERSALTLGCHAHTMRPSGRFRRLEAATQR